MKAALFPKLAQYLTAQGLSRVHPDATENTARAAVAALAGLGHSEQLWSGDLHTGVQLVSVISGEKLPGVELARRAPLLAERAVALGERVKGEVQVLQLVAYDRPVPSQERSFILGKARVQPWFPLSRGQVATWIFALSEPALYATRFRGWPPELSADQLRALLAG